jgi:uncharacterized protein (DUF1501 family)
MKRRDFIRAAAPLAVVPFFSNQLFAAAMPHTLQDEAILGMLGPETDRVLVIIQMNGGNDGLNMVLPLDQYSNLAAARANILIPDTSALVLGSTQTGLHPAMTGLKSLYDDRKLTVVLQQSELFALSGQRYLEHGFQRQHRLDDRVAWALFGVCFSRISRRLSIDFDARPALNPHRFEQRVGFARLRNQHGTDRSIKF